MAEPTPTPFSVARASSVLVRTIAIAALILATCGVVRADNRDPRRRWEYAGGCVRRSLAWVEQTDKTTHTFYEVSRNAVFVELFDPVRQATARLYANKVLLRDGKKYLKLSRLADGAWTDSAKRSQWHSSKIDFLAQRGDSDRAGDSPGTPVWVERNLSGIYVFHEAQRTNEFVELKDRERDYTIRLSGGDLRIQGGNEKVPKKFPKFTRLYTGRWAPVRKAVVPKVVLDVKQAPEAAHWAAGAKRVVELWYSILYEILYPGGYAPPRTITIIFKDPTKFLAYTIASKNEITISAKWVRDHPDDIGMVIHELTHIVQSYPESKGVKIFWITEGIADYVRYYDFEPEKDFYFNRKNSYLDGYGMAATFLHWIDCTRGPHVVEKLNARLAIGAYNDDLFENYAHEPLADLWTAFKPTLQRKPKTSPR